jgi:hypothetical protein
MDFFVALKNPSPWPGEDNHCTMEVTVNVVMNLKSSVKELILSPAEYQFLKEDCSAY